MATISPDPELTLAAERDAYRTFFRFFRLIDTSQWDRVAAECFTSNATLSYQSPQITLSGSEQLQTHFVEHGPSIMERTAHVAGQTLIDWEDGRPTLTAYVTAWHWFKATAAQGETRPADWTVVGLVQDSYREVDGRWLIEDRKVTSVGGPVAVGTLPG